MIFIKNLELLIDKNEDFAWISLLENFYRHLLESGKTITFLCENFEYIALPDESTIKAGFFVKNGSTNRESYNKVYENIEIYVKFYNLYEI